MAGGMVLLGVLLTYFDVATGMILFSIIQLFANGWRALQWRHYVLWPIFFWYVAGAVIAFAVMWTIAFVPDKATVYLALGLMPFAVELLPRAMRPNIEWQGVPVLTGMMTTVIQILAGVGGLFLDIFFQKSTLDRKTTNATKAVAQSFSHVVRAGYFGSLSGIADVPLWAMGPAILLAIAGTSLGAASSICSGPSPCSGIADASHARQLRRFFGAAMPIVTACKSFAAALRNEFS